MNSGKVSNSIIKRAVLKLIKKTKNPRIVTREEIGVEGLIVNNEADKSVMAVSNSLYSVFRVANTIASVKGNMVAAQGSVVMPCDFNEPDLRQIIRDLNSQCEILNVQLSCGDVHTSDAVVKPVVTVTGLGNIPKELTFNRKIQPDSDIVVTKWIGIEGIRQICDKRREEILALYTEALIDKAVDSIEDMLVVPEAELVKGIADITMHPVSEGGIFAALWNMSEAGNVGIDIDFKKIPVKQEIIEVCEIFDINPYELASSGCLIMTSKQGYDIVNILKTAGIPAVIIGKTTDSNDKIIRNEDEVRYLDQPKRDEIYKLGNI